MTDRLRDPGRVGSLVVHDWHLSDDAIKARHLSDGIITAIHIADRTRNIWISAGVFTLAAGAPALAVQGSNFVYRAWAMDSAADENVVAEIMVPEDWASGTLTHKLYWTNLGAGTGNVVWNVSVKSIPDAGDINSTSGATVPTITAAAPTQNLLKISTLSAGPTGVASGFFRLLVQRQGSTAADTLGNDAGFLGLEIEYTADS